MRLLQSFARGRRLGRGKEQQLRPARQGVLRRALTAALCGICLSSGAGSSDLAAAPEAALAQIRAAAPDLAHPLDPAGLRLSTGFATLDLASGVLIPVRTAGGRMVEMVFIGRGQAHLEPPDDVEAGQLELFTGSRRLTESFTEAVFVVARDAAARALLERAPAASDPQLLRRAAARYEDWKASPERRTLGVETGILLDALGDPLYEAYFAGWFLGDDLGPFLLQLDPAAEEQINLGQFVRVDVTPEEKQSLTRFLHRQQQRGRLVGLEVEDIGRWDSWVQAPLASDDGRPLPGSAGFEPIHYALDVTVDPRAGHLAGLSRVTLRALTGGRRVVRLELHADLELSRVADGAGRELFFLREGSDVQVVLPRVPERGSEVVLEVECAGGFLERGSGEGWALRDGLGWYPRSGANERATYDVTLRWPRRFELVASGRRADGGEAGGMRWERRLMEVPTLGFSFEVGRFEIESTDVGHVRLNVALDPATLEVAPEGALGELVRTVADALTYYEEVFGAYPLDELTVVTVPRQYSQAMLGFITLSGRLMVDWGVFGPLLRVQDRGSVVAHEVAHQWWGHLVGWRSYRDQWISEAMANYAALLWARHRGLRPAVGPVTGWQQELTATLADGRPLESLGPMVLGERLFSSRSQDAYHAIVYRKGALVLEMLARKFGEDAFLRALKALIAKASGHVIATSDFLTLLEGIAGIDLEPFARQFIFGTGLPEIYYDYAFEPTPAGRWKVRIEAEQEMPARTRYAVVARPDGRLDVARSRVDPPHDVERSELVVPFQILLAPDPALASPAGARDRVLVGRLVISGRESEIELEIDQQPAKLWLDRDRQVFGRFLDRRRHPKRMLFQQASKQAAAGELEAAAETLRRAMATRSPLASTDHLLDAHLHLRLAHVRLDAGSVAAAAASLELARGAFECGVAELPTSEKRRFARAFEVLEARLEIRKGEFARAFERLAGGVLDPRDATSTEGYLLLAIAALETGRARELEEAMEMARQRGADVSQLRSSAARPPPLSAR